MESSDNEFLTVDVGSRLRQLRQERGKSMRALARASGLSTNALSMIERSRTSPSVSTLYKLAEALEVPITAFFRLEPQKQAIVYCQGEKRKRVIFPEGVWEGLGGESFIGRVEPFVISIAPGGASGPYGMLHTGHEFVLCMNGRLEYTIEDQVFLLEQGDSLIFSAQLRHRWKNPTDRKTIALIVISGFEQDERPSEFHLSPHQRNIAGYPEMIGAEDEGR
jgi:transcriptional regulator with XRE-family HTH domain